MKLIGQYDCGDLSCRRLHDFLLGKGRHLHRLMMLYLFVKQSIDGGVESLINGGPTLC